MTWIKLIDTFPDHPKAVAAGDQAAWLYVSGLCYCSRHLTDGKISRAALARLTGLSKPEKHAERLVEVGLWVVTADGWLVHDYTDVQRSRDVVERERTATRERVKKHRDKRSGNAVTNGGVSPSDTEAETDTDPSGGRAARPDERSQHPVVELVATYVDEYRAAHGGESPARSWKDQAGRHAKNLLEGDVPFADVEACLIAAGKEGKSPTVLPHILRDLHHERALEAS